MMIISLKSVLQAAEKVSGLSVEQIKTRGRSRKMGVVTTRHAAMAAVKELTGKSYPWIGLHFGGYDHTTVLHACRVTETCPIRKKLKNEIIEETYARATPSYSTASGTTQGVYPSVIVAAS